MTNVPSTLTHITDVGAPSGDGSDSIKRIIDQYQAVGVSSPIVIPAGQSPFNVAFTGCTTLSNAARQRALRALGILGLPKPKIQPIALNSAPRNDTESHDNGQEDHIYRVKFEGKDQKTFLIYGPEVLRWVLAFRGRIGVQVEKIIVLKGGNGEEDVIPDTSNGSQFRSAEHLPIVHLFEALGELDQHSTRETVGLDNIPDFYPYGEKAVAAPPDEYDNGRLLVNAQQASKILSANSVRIPEITAVSLAVRRSLTNVVPGELSVWPSSNHFPGEASPHVLNIGTHWQEGQTHTTDEQVIALARLLSNNVGKSHEVQFV